MNLKKCPCCAKQLTTRNVEKVSRLTDAYGDILLDFLYFTCKICKSTAVIGKKHSIGVYLQK